MGSTLEHGIYLPSEGEKNCYQGLAGNWNKVDGALGDIAELKQSIESKFTKEIVTELPTEDINPFCIYMILKTDPETDNVYDEWVYINNSWEYLGNTKVDMTQYYTKQEVNQLPAVASGVTATKVGNYDAHIANGDIHVTTSDKTKWTNSANTHVLRLAKSALTPSSSTNAFSNLDDSTALKVGDKVMDTAGVIFEVTAIDTQNSTFTIGTALIDLAQDSGVVHVTGDETVAGNKNFQGLLTTTPSESLWPTGLNTTDDITYLGSEVIHLEYKSSGKLTDLSSGAWNVAALGAGCFFFRINNGKDIRYKNLATGDVNRIPVVSGTNRFINDVTPDQDNTYGLGSSSLRWRTINGLNPSALGMPDLDNGIDISSYITAGNTHNEYTPLVNGWISVILKSTSGDLALFVYQGGMVNAQFGKTSLPNETDPCVMVSIPVNGGIVVNIDTKGSNSYVYSAKFFPCQGNV